MEPNAAKKLWDQIREPILKLASEAEDFAETLVRPNAFHQNAEGHPRQCKAMKNPVTHTGRLARQCNKWAVQGRDYCHFHGGKVPTGKRLKWKRGRVSAYYSKHLGKSLAAALDEQNRRAPSELLSLYEEIAVTRVAAQQALAFAGAIFDKQGVSDSAKAQAAQVCICAMKQVAEIVEKAAKIESASEDKISVRSGVRLIEQIIRVMHDVLGDENADVIKLISERINAEVRVPLEAIRGHKEDDTTIGKLPVAIGVVNVQVNKGPYNAEDPVAVRARSEGREEIKMIASEADVPPVLIDNDIVVSGANT